MWASTVILVGEKFITLVRKHANNIMAENNFAIFYVI